MPVARSDPRRATIVGIVGIVVGTLLVVGVLLVNNLGTGSSTTQSSRTRFDVGPAASLANSIREQGPLFFNDTATGARPLAVQHFGDDPTTGWRAFDAAIGTCTVTWDAQAQHFVDCKGVRYPPDGTGLHQYPVTVENGELFVNLSIDATTTTTSTTPAAPPTS
jgi:hypothetical protein